MGLLSGIKNHPVISIAAAVVILASFWAGYFLATFDLNDYRRQLQDSLETRLSVPVRLGQAKLRLRDAGIAVSFRDVAIGDESSRFSLEAPELWLSFEWSALFRQKLHFSKIGLFEPTVRFDIPPELITKDPGQDATSGFLAKHFLLNGISIRTLEIRSGRFKINTSSDPQQPRLISVSDVNMLLTGLTLGQEATITLSAMLEQTSAPASLTINGTAGLPAGVAAWAASPIDLNVAVSDLESAMVEDFLSAQQNTWRLQGNVNFTAKLAGSFEGGLSLSARLDSSQLNLSTSELPHPYPLRHIQADGMLYRTDDRYRLENLAIHLDGISLTGEATLHQMAHPRILDISLTQGSLPIEALSKLLPTKSEQALLTDPTGSVRIEKGHFTIELEPTPELPFRMNDSHLEMTLNNLSWQISPALKAELTSLKIIGEGQSWELREGIGKLGSTPVSLDGRVTFPADTAPTLELQLEGVLRSTELLSLLEQQPNPDLAISGPLPYRAKLTGTPQRLDVDVDMQLDAIDVSYAGKVHLPPESESLLSLHGVLSRQNFEISFANLQRKTFNGRLSGRIDWGKEASTNLNGLLEIRDVASLQTMVPSLEPFKLSGAANLEFQLEGPLGKLHRQAVLTLQDIAISTRGIIGDVSLMQGKVNLTERGFATEKMLARIGESQVSFTARLSDYTAPALILDIQARKIRADELIFNSDQIYLHDLVGRLNISAERIEFSNVQVGLPKGTEVTVNGWATGQPNLQVNLDITSEFANIQEVIGLWAELSPQARDQREARKQKHSGEDRPHQVVIRAKVAKGDLYGMRFQNAVGTIEHRPGLLLIHPLDFKIEEGDCTTQIIVASQSTGPQLLRISGHAQDVDAYAVYNELLKQKSILRGNLSGDFYLQGDIGANYLPTSYGRFDIEIHKGVLRQFQVLSKIFSLLNVSQLFSLKLPDMDLEGMPFDKISGSLILKQGILSSDDLVVKSEAMNQSYIGNLNLINKQLDLTLAVQPLGTVDKILSRIPVAGWLLTGKEKAFITTHFSITGDITKPEVDMLPVTSLSEKTLGLIRRTLGLPVKLVTDPSILWGGSSDED